MYAAVKRKVKNARHAGDVSGSLVKRDACSPMVLLNPSKMFYNSY